MGFHGHVFISGQTFTGKSTFAREVYAKRYLESGINVLILDPNFDNWPCTWKTDNFDKFYHAARSSQSCLLIVDEGSESLDWYDERSNWLVKRSRHYGHRVVICSQRPADVSMNIRSQMSVAHAFYQNTENDAKAVARMTGIDYRKILSLPFYHCYTWEARKGAEPPRLQRLKIAA
jgi:hypothetical protein